MITNGKRLFCYPIINQLHANYKWVKNPKDLLEEMGQMATRKNLDLSFELSLLANDIKVPRQINLTMRVPFHCYHKIKDNIYNLIN